MQSLVHDAWHEPLYKLAINPQQAVSPRQTSALHVTTADMSALMRTHYHQRLSRRLIILCIMVGVRATTTASCSLSSDYSAIRLTFKIHIQRPQKHDRCCTSQWSPSSLQTHDVKSSVSAWMLCHIRRFCCRRSAVNAHFAMLPAWASPAALKSSQCTAIGTSTVTALRLPSPLSPLRWQAARSALIACLHIF